MREVVSAWLRVAVGVADDGAMMARWLDAVAALVDLRRRTRAE